MRRKLLVPLVGILVVAFGGLLLSLVAGDTPALGLDLQGGISITQQPVGEFAPEALDLAVERIRDRVDSLGVAEPEIIRQGDAIVVNLPGVKNQKEAIALVQVTGQVYLRPVQGCVDEGVTTTTTTTVDGTTTTLAGATTTVAAPTTTAAPGPSRRPFGVDSSVPQTTGSDTTVPETTPTGSVPDSTVAGGTTPDTSPAIEPLTTAVISDPTQQQVLPIRSGGQCLVGPSGASGAVFQNNATADIIGAGWGVTVSLRDGASGVDQWNALAQECYSGGSTCPSHRLAIELDGEIISAPSVNEPQFKGSVQITGDFSETEAKGLANVLRSGSLPVKMQTQSVQTVSATLGKDSLNAAIISGLIGVGLVLLFMILYYRSLGLIVCAGLCVSGVLLYSIISFLSRTQGLALSLAGVAGVIVSIGVTVDSYVVFFERLKDEIRSGRTMRNSAQRGFAGAWRTILLADIVSLMGAAVLWYLTVGSVRNFAFFLGLSTLIDLFVSYFFTRPSVLLLARTDWMARRKVMGIEAVRLADSTAGSAS